MVVDNHDLSMIVDTNHEWIVSRTGIEKRRICLLNEDVLHMSIKAVESLCLSPEEVSNIGVIIVATTTNKRSMPSIASSIHAHLKCNLKVVAFDLNDACNGFVQAVTIACKYIHNTKLNALIVGADHMSSILNWNDRNTCVLFGDGAGSILISGQNIANFFHSSYTLGEFNDAIVADEHIKMNGSEVYKKAVDYISKDIISLLSQAGYKAGDIDYYVVHQANARIIEEVRNRVAKHDNSFNPASMIECIAQSGNTSAATIPIALNSIKSKLKPDDKVMLSGFAAGLRGGSVLICSKQT